MREDEPHYFEDIKGELLEKRYVTDWPLTNLGSRAVPVFQYTFSCHFNTLQFF